MENVLCEIGKKTENIFQDTSNKISENFNIKHLRWSKADLPKEKKKVLRQDTLRSSVAAVRRCTVKKVSLNNSPPVYWHITKIPDIHHVQNP